jgi:hypothetical protein
MTQNDTNHDDLETVIETLRKRRYTESAEIEQAGAHYLKEVDEQRGWMEAGR